MVYKDENGVNPRYHQAAALIQQHYKDVPIYEKDEVKPPEEIQVALTSNEQLRQQGSNDTLLRNQVGDRDIVAEKMLPSKLELDGWKFIETPVEKRSKSTQTAPARALDDSAYYIMYPAHPAPTLLQFWRKDDSENPRRYVKKVDESQVILCNQSKVITVCKIKENYPKHVMDPAENKLKKDGYINIYNPKHCRILGEITPDDVINKWYFAYTHKGDVIPQDKLNREHHSVRKIILKNLHLALHMNTGVVTEHLELIVNKFPGIDALHLEVYDARCVPHLYACAELEPIKIHHDDETAAAWKKHIQDAGRESDKAKKQGKADTQDMMYAIWDSKVWVRWNYGVRWEPKFVLENANEEQRNSAEKLVR